MFSFFFRGDGSEGFLSSAAAIQDAEAKMERLKQEQEGWYWAAVAREDKVSSLPKKKK